MKIKYKLLLTYGILVVLAFVIVGVNLFTFQTIESDSNFINYAGKLRATSYKMAQLSNVLVNNENEEKRAELRESIESYDLILDSVCDGNKELGLTKLTHKPTIERMDIIKYQWNSRYKISYVAVVNHNDAESLEIINDEISHYVNTLNVMVTAYSENSRDKVIHAIFMNLALIFISIIVALISYYFINNGIRKPLSELIEDLKELSIVDINLAQKIKTTSKDEIVEMTGYFNELIYDSLTKAYTRGTGLSKLNRIVQNEEEIDFKMCFCFADINGLKQVNDILGHKYGDELIISTVDAMKSVIRENDFIIRMGGDEFLIVLYEINKEQAEIVWNRIVGLYEKINKTENRAYLVSVSHGIVDYDSQNNPEIDELIKIADEKMYEEKRIIKQNFNVIK